MHRPGLLITFHPENNALGKRIVSNRQCPEALKTEAVKQVAEPNHS